MVVRAVEAQLQTKPHEAPGGVRRSLPRPGVGGLASGDPRGARRRRPAL